MVITNDCVKRLALDVKYILKNPIRIPKNNNLFIIKIIFYYINTIYTIYTINNIQNKNLNLYTIIIYFIVLYINYKFFYIKII